MREINWAEPSPRWSSSGGCPASHRHLIGLEVEDSVGGGEKHSRACLALNSLEELWLASRSTSPGAPSRVSRIFVLNSTASMAAATVPGGVGHEA